MMCEKCLYCYQPLSGGELHFHAKCSKKMFGSRTAPVIPYKRSEIVQLAREVIRSQTTITGVQPKLSLDFAPTARTPQRFTIVGLWGRFILKPQTDLYPNLPELEDLVMHLAEIAHIYTVPHSLITMADGELCYITRRIDRTASGEKIAMEDMCQLSGRLTEDKYKGSHERVAKLIAKLSSTPQLCLVNYWEQVMLAWITGNADMHLKNYSLYAPDGNHHMLTPAYDLLSTAIVLPDDTEELALTLCGKKRKLSKAHFFEAMMQSGLSEKVCRNIVAKFQKAQPEWAAFIAQSFLPDDMQRQLAELIEGRMSLLRDEA